MTQDDALGECLDALEAAAVPYMIVGSVASSYWGRPRSTQDCDVVVELSSGELEALLERLRPTWYVPAGLARDAVRDGGMFNAIHHETGLKVDLIAGGSAGRAREALARRVQTEYLGRRVWFASAEDTILAKLRWHRRGGGERQLGDIAGILAVRKGRLDLELLRREAEEAGVAGLLEELLGRSS